MSGTAMRAEILEQPAAWRRALAEREAIARIGGVVRGARPRSIVFVARGTSGHAARYGRYLVETMTGIPTSILAPSVVTVYDAVPRLEGAVVVALSQSGASPDLVAALAAARHAGALTIAMVNSVDSPLAAAAEHVVDVLAGPELAVAATKSYTAELLALALLCSEIAGEELPWSTLPELGERALDGAGIPAAADALAGAERAAVLGRGYSLATARETALKLMETSYVWAQGFSTAEFAHGPIAALGSEVPVVLVAGAEEHPDTLVRGIRAAGSPLVIVGDDPAGDAVAVVPVPGIDRRLRPLVEMLPLQLLALELAVGRGHDPDRPRGLRKATLTR